MHSVDDLAVCLNDFYWTLFGRHIWIDLIVFINVWCSSEKF